MVKSLSLKPIGYLRSVKRLKFDTPHQPKHQAAEENTIELLPGNNFEQALKDLDGFERIWLIWWFDRNQTWRPRVLPPRGGKTKRGVFATRSPHRPNAIGMSVVNLLSVKGRKLLVGPTDLIDGTPVFDIKPYIPEHDSFPGSRSGWLEEIKEDIVAHYKVKLTKLAKTQVSWLNDNWQINFIERAIEILSIDPSPHRTRRISKRNDGYMIGCGAWRAFFTVKDYLVEVHRLGAGYPAKALFDTKYDQIPDREAQIAFNKEFGDK